MKYEITLFGNPVLREKSEPVKTFDEDIAKLYRDMLETMYGANGIGLAAQQIDKTLAICVIDIPPEADMDAHEQRLNPDIAMPLAIINPEILEFGETEDVYEEGCLSFPGLSGNVQRPTTIKLRYQDEKGDAHEIEPKGLLARALQHEIDHLNGNLFIEKLGYLKRKKIEKEYRKAQTKN